MRSEVYDDMMEAAVGGCKVAEAGTEICYGNRFYYQLSARCLYV